MTPTKKLIEVALPLDAINKASAREKSIRHGHPSTLHLWWARRPLASYDRQTNQGSPGKSDAGAGRGMGQYEDRRGAPRRALSWRVSVTI